MSVSSVMSGFQDLRVLLTDAFVLIGGQSEGLRGIPSEIIRVWNEKYAVAIKTLNDLENVFEKYEKRDGLLDQKEIRIFELESLTTKLALENVMLAAKAGMIQDIPETIRRSLNHLSEQKPKPIDPLIIAAIKDRDSRTDRWGEDLVFLVLHDLKDREYVNKWMPEHKEGCDLFRKLSNEERFRVLREVLDQPVKSDAEEFDDDGS